MSAASMEQEHLSAGLFWRDESRRNYREGGSSGASIEANDTRWRLSVMSYTNTLDMNESQVRKEDDIRASGVVSYWGLKVISYSITSFYLATA